MRRRCLPLSLRIFNWALLHGGGETPINLLVLGNKVCVAQVVPWMRVCAVLNASALGKHISTITFGDVDG